MSHFEESNQFIPGQLSQAEYLEAITTSLLRDLAQPDFQRALGEHATRVAAILPRLELAQVSDDGLVRPGSQADRGMIGVVIGDESNETLHLSDEYLRFTPHQYQQLGQSVVGQIYREFTGKEVADFYREHIKQGTIKDLLSASPTTKTERGGKVLHCMGMVQLRDESFLVKGEPLIWMSKMRLLDAKSSMMHEVLHIDQTEEGPVVLASQASTQFAADELRAYQSEALYLGHIRATDESGLLRAGPLAFAEEIEAIRVEVLGESMVPTEALARALRERDQDYHDAVYQFKKINEVS